MAKDKLFEGFYSDEDVRASIATQAQLEGSQSALAKALGVSPAYLSDVLNGHRGISDAFAAKIGYRRVSGWERMVME